MSFSIAPSLPSPLRLALSWLVANESSDGSNGPYFEEYTAASAYALWLNDSKSQDAERALSYLAGQLNNSGTWFWPPPFGEADVPGEILTAITLTDHLNLIQNLSEVSSRLLQFQQQYEYPIAVPGGGFIGYYDNHLARPASVTSSVDTAMALLGLSESNTIPDSNRTAAVSYLQALQNGNGSFNLTSTIAANPIYSLGPDQTSITALVCLALRDEGFTANSPSIVKALNYLSQAAQTSFGGPRRVYDASLSTIAFLEYNRPGDAISALVYLIAQQKADGGFSDYDRTSRESNALDTGWAAIAMQYGVTEGAGIFGTRGSGEAPPINQPPTGRFVFNPSEPTNGSIVSFNATSSSDSDGDSLSYSWSFGDGAFASGPIVTHAYPKSGAFTVTLMVTDSGTNPDELTATAWQNITVQASQPPPRTAIEPLLPVLSPTLDLVIVSLFIVVAIVAASQFIKTRKNRSAKKSSSRAQATSSTGSA